MRTKSACFAASLTAILFSAGVSLSAEPPPTLWSINLNQPDYLWGHFFDVDPTPDGGAVSAGHVSTLSSGSGLSYDNYDAIVMKTAAGGTEEWRTVVVSTEKEEKVSITPVPDGGYVVAATAWTPYGQLPYPGEEIFSYYNSFLVKLDQSGNELWRKYFHPETLALAIDVVATADGGLLLAGKTSSDFCPTVLKLDQDGEILWSTNIQEIDDGAYNGSGKVIETSDGGYAAAFECNTGVALVVLDPQGNVSWSSSYLENAFYLPVSSFMQKSDGGFVIAGGSAQIPNSDVYWWSMAWVSARIETDKNGHQTSELIVEENGTAPRAALATRDGGLLISSDNAYRKVDSSGAEEWSIPHDFPEVWYSYPIPGEKYIYDLVEPAEGGYLLAGTIGVAPENGLSMYNIFAPYLEMLGPDTVGEEAISVAVSVTGAKKGVINLANNRIVRLTVFGSQDFAVSTLDLEEAAFAGASPVRAAKTGLVKALYKDVNKDGSDDVLLDFKASEMSTEGGLVFLCETQDGTPVIGDSGVTVIKSSKNKNKSKCKK